MWVMQEINYINTHRGQRQAEAQGDPEVNVKPKESQSIDRDKKIKKSSS